ncbi:MAG: CD225/dispanin family protein [Gordonia sp. (in: high G+C Gram-positive bacteria)]
MTSPDDPNTSGDNWAKDNWDKGNWAAADWTGVDRPAPAIKPDSNLVWGILTTVLCCVPLGVVAIVYAAKVDKLWLLGDVEGARKASAAARNWSIGSAVATVVLVALFIGVAALAGTLSDPTSPPYSDYTPTPTSVFPYTPYIPAPYPTYSPGPLTYPTAFPCQALPEGC